MWGACLALAWGNASAWALNDLVLTAGSSTVVPGDTLLVTLDVANLTAPINGVQVLVRYDPTILSLQGVTPTNLGLTPPAEGWVQVDFSDLAGDVTFAAVVNGGSVAANDTIATFTFAVVGEGTTSVTFRPDTPPFLTKITTAADNQSVVPNKIDSVAITSACDDGLFCNGQETIVGGVCQPGTPPDCSALTDQCNVGVCNETLDTCEAQPTNEGLACDDGDLCTTGDVCTAGVCAGTAVDCSALTDACNVGTCNPATGICEAVPANEGLSCDDGIFCNGTETCSAGTCVSSGDPCAPLFCDETTRTCTAPIHITALEVFYAGRFADAADPTKFFLATGATATLDNVTNYTHGITGIRVTFDNVVTFATTPIDALTFEWTTGTGTTFSAVTGVATAVTATAQTVGGVTVLDIVIADDHVRRRWLKVTLDATQVTVNGVMLDGELAGNPVTLPSGDGTPGGNAVFYLGNVSGDVNADRKTLLQDVGLIRAAVNPFVTVPITDINDVNKDGKVLLSDVGEARLDVNPFFVLPLITP